MCPLVGRLSEIFGRKAMLLFAVSTFTVFSLGCALSNSIAQLAIFRGLAGVGGGAIMSSCVACRGHGSVEAAVAHCRHADSPAQVASRTPIHPLRTARRVMIVISDITSARKRGLAIAPIGIMFALSSIIGPLLGGALTGVSSDGWCGAAVPRVERGRVPPRRPFATHPPGVVAPTT